MCQQLNGSISPVLYAATGIAVVVLLFFILYSSVPAIRTPFLSDAQRLQSTPNNQLTDDQIVSQANKIQAVKAFMMKHPEPKISVFRFDDHLVHVIYSNETTVNTKGTTIESLEILLGESATYAQDSYSTSMIYHCGDRSTAC